MLLVFELGWLASELWSVNSASHALLASTLLTELPMQALEKQLYRASAECMQCP